MRFTSDYGYMDKDHTTTPGTTCSFVSLSILLSIEKIYQRLDSILSAHFQISRSLTKKPHCVLLSYFQLSSGCLDKW